MKFQIRLLLLTASVTLSAFSGAAQETSEAPAPPAVPIVDSPLIAPGSEEETPAVAPAPKPLDKRAPNYAPGEEPAVLSVFNRSIMVVRENMMGYSPKLRARRITDRIEGFIDKGNFGPVTHKPRTEGEMILIGGEYALTVGYGDVDRFSDATIEDTVGYTVERLTEALNEAKLQTSSPYLAAAAFKCLIATCVFFVLALALYKIYQLILPPILRWTQKIEKWIKESGYYLASQIMRAVKGLTMLSFALVLLMIASQWLSYCLTRFPYTRPWGNVVHDEIADLIAGFFHSIIIAIPDLAIIVLILIFTRLLVSVTKGFFSGIESGQVELDWMTIEAARATRRIVNIMLWLFAIVMIYPYIPGSDSNAFKGMSVFVGLLFSLGSSSVIGQFTSGLVLMYSRALKPGEYVRIGEQEGTVESLGFLSTKIRSPKNEEFHVPNLVILGTTIKNFSRLASQGPLFLRTTITVGYDTPWRQVHAMLIEAACKTPGLANSPPPFVLQTALCDHYVEYEINACAPEPEQRIALLARLRAEIQDQFNAHGVQIMSPHYMADKDDPVIVPPEDWHTPPASKESGAPSVYRKQRGDL
ncbi:MAG: mechanosensitive ion channel domain-containing protein [Verrucomicrobiota bacterium]